MSGLHPEDADRLDRATKLLASSQDIVAERPATEEPTWVGRRGWRAFLEHLSEGALAHCERVGLAAALSEPHVASPAPPIALPVAADEGAAIARELAAAPADLRELAMRVVQITTLAPALASSLDPSSVDGRRASVRKRSQVAAFVAIVSPRLADRARVIDVGSGHGHLTRHLGRELPLPVEGWEIDAARVAVAETLPHAHTTMFRPLDVREHVNELRGDDIVIGLHACGELADHAIAAAARTGAAVALVGCCLQKRRGSRTSSSSAAAAAPPLGRDVLGLGNVTVGEPGVEEPLAVRLRSRENRIALGFLLAEAGAVANAGEEMRGLNRRKATGSLDELVEACFSVRGLAAPSAAEVRSAADRAATLHARRRRWDLPRLMLGRVIEVWIATDRAAALGEASQRAYVRTAFPASESPRNLIVLSEGRGTGRAAR